MTRKYSSIYLILISLLAQACGITVLPFPSGKIQDTPVANQWHFIGQPHFVQSYASGKAAVAVDPFGTAYVAFEDSSISNRVSVMKYSSGTWSLVGSAGISSSQVLAASLAFDSVGTPYLAYLQGSFFGQMNVVKFSSGSWSLVGASNFDNAYTVALALDPSNTPYVAMEELGGKASVMKYSSGSWGYVGSAGISVGSVVTVSLAIQSNGTPYVAYSDGGLSNAAVVMKYSGGSWSQFGPDVSSNGTPLLAISPQGVFYTAYKDGSGTNTLTVAQYAGASWGVVGSAEFTPAVNSFSFALDPSGTPYVAFEDMQDVLNEMTYENGEWVSLGSGDSNPLNEGLATSNFAFTVDSQGKSWIVASDGLQYLSAYLYSPVAPAYSLGWAESYPSASTSIEARWVAPDTSQGPTDQMIQYYSDPNCDTASGGLQDLHSANSNSEPAVGTAGVQSSYRIVSYFSGQDPVWSYCSTPMGVAPSFGFSNSLPIINGVGTTLTTVLAYDPSDGTPYFAYASSSGSVTVLEYGSGSWNVLGTPNFVTVSTETASLSLAIYEGTPYLAYADVDFNLNVVSYSGGSWNQVGSADLATDAAYLSLAIDQSSGTPYLAYDDFTAGSVMKYTAGSWSLVGPVHFTGSGAFSIQIAINPSTHAPYVAYEDISKSQKLSVRSYNAGSWSYVGSSGFSPSSVGGGTINLQIDPSGTPYATGGGIIAKYSAGSWSSFGPAAANGAGDLALSPDGVPFLEYADSTNSNLPAIAEYVSGSWSLIGSEGFTPYTPYLLIVPEEGVPWFAVYGGPDGNTVMNWYP